MKTDGASTHARPNSSIVASHNQPTAADASTTSARLHLSGPSTGPSVRPVRPFLGYLAPCVVFLLAMVGLAILVPWMVDSSCCVYRREIRQTRDWLGIRVSDRTIPNRCSEWINQFSESVHDHQWAKLDLFGKTLWGSVFMTASRDLSPILRLPSEEHLALFEQARQTGRTSEFFESIRALDATWQADRDDETVGERFHDLRSMTFTEIP